MEDQLTAYVMVGAPGSGKSTYAAKLAQIEDAVVISGDLIRDEIEKYGLTNPSWVEIWDKVEEEVAEAVENGKNVILDGTHVGSEHRKEVVFMCNSYGYTCVKAVIMDTSFEECLQRNSKRKSFVPEHVITHMHDRLQREIKFVEKEGFNEVRYCRRQVVLNENDVGACDVAR